MVMSLLKVTCTRVYVQKGHSVDSFSHGNSSRPTREDPNPMQFSSMRRRSGAEGGGFDGGEGAYRHEVRRGSLLTRAVNAVFAFVRMAEFEIVFVLFLLVAFLIFKDLVST